MFTIGCDVEIFGKTSEGKHIALCDKIGGSKSSPLQVPHLPEGFAVQEDNVALEYNIPPADTMLGFVENVSIMRAECKTILKTLTLELSEVASMSFDTEQLVSDKAKEFGCEPDYNAWTKKQNPRPKTGNPFLRTCGGHVHVGTDEQNMIDGTKLMDLFLGVPSVLLDNSPSSVERRRLYGKAGAMRPKPYGWEYRVLSNFWMFNNKLIAWVYDNTRRAVKEEMTLPKSMGKDIQACINTGDKSLAGSLIKEFNISMPGDELIKEEEVLAMPNTHNRLNWPVWRTTPIFATAEGGTGER